MYPCTADVPLEHLSILQRIVQEWIGAKGSLLELGDVLERSPDGDILDVGDFVGDELGEAVTLRERKALHASYVLDGTLGSHRAIGDDVRYTLVAVLLRDPMQDIRATIIVKVHVNIRHRDTVWIEETLEEEVVANRVNVGNA